MTELNAVVTERVDFTPDLMILRVAPDGWELPDFRAGQYALLGLPPQAPRSASSGPESAPDPDSAPDAESGATDPEAPAPELIRRAYSVASSSVEREYVEFYVAQVRSGALTPRLFALGIGDRVHLTSRFTGMFTLDQVPADQHLVLVATGTGLAPYMSMIRTHVEADPARKVLVLHGARNSWDLAYRTELFHLQRFAPGFTYLPIIDGPQDEVVPWRGQVGFVQDLWKAGMVEQLWGLAPTPLNCHVFLCGNPLMIEAMSALLIPEGFTVHRRHTPGRLHIEEF
jgi:ferredoxin--NADP+ reductase